MSLPVSSSPSDVVLDAPCKVNLTLDVGPLRADGFHELDSLVLPLASPADNLRVTRRDGTRQVRLLCKSDTVPKGPENLAYRAAQLFLDRFLPNASVTLWVRLEKRLPTQAGLGGGSSDAASVLSACAQLFPDAATKEQLLEVAGQIGSDVPLFLTSGPCRIQGRGEHVLPLPQPLPPLYGVLVKPSVGVPTGPAYAILDGLADRATGQAMAHLWERIVTGQVTNAAQLAPLLSNDFEAAVLPAFPSVGEAHQAVHEAGALRTLLCGSGASVFGLARNREHARDLTRQLCGRGFWVKMARGQTPEEAPL